jgi:hypothetical protein
MTALILDSIDHINNLLQSELLAIDGLAPRFTPLGKDIEVKDIDPSEIPQTPDQLGELISYSYDLSIKRAGELNIPVVGTISGSLDRRVVILEWTRYKQLLDQNGIQYRYGYVIRFCLTINKWDAQSQVRLPVLSAQAELGQIQASWLMQVRGLTGKKIDEVIVPPQELNVSTFIIAKQSLEKAIAAVNDPGTKFVPGILIATIDPTTPEIVFWLAAVRTFALTCILRGRTQLEAVGRLQSSDPAASESIRETYHYLSITDPSVRPSNAQRGEAGRILRGIMADV